MATTKKNGAGKKRSAKSIRKATRKTAAKREMHARRSKAMAERPMRTDTQTFLMHGLFLKGYGNRKVLKALQKRFGKKVIGDEHLNHVRWHRWDMAKRGLIPKRFARDQQPA